MSSENAVSLLPHHFEGFCEIYNLIFSNMIVDDHSLDVGINSYSMSVERGVVNSDYYVRIPNTHPLFSEYQGLVSYRFDVHGNKQTLVSLGIENALKEFFIGDPSEMTYLGLKKDKICGECALAIHCDENLRDREKGKKEDNLALECMYAWYLMSQIVADNSPIDTSHLNPNLRLWLRQVEKFGEMVKEGNMEFSFNADRVQSVGIKRGVVLKNIANMHIYLTSPGPTLLWSTKEKRVFSDLKTVVRPESFEEIFTIISAIETLKYKILSSRPENKD